MDTKNFTYPELMNEININCGGISSSAAVYTDKAASARTVLCMRLRVRRYMRKFLSFLI